MNLNVNASIVRFLWGFWDKLIRIEFLSAKRSTLGMTFLFKLCLH